MSTSPAAPAAPSTPPKTTGGYIVLAQQAKPPANGVTSAPTGGWSVVAENIAARSAEHAVRVYAEKKAGEAGDKAGLVLVAIPVKSWRPLKVTPNTVTKLVVEDVKP